MLHKLLPRIRPQLVDADRSANPLELFYDLAFVASISGAVISFAAAPGWLAIGHFLLFFLPLWWAWIGWTFFVDRFHADDLHHFLLFGAKVICVLLMGLAITRGFESGLPLFAAAYAAVRFALVWQYLLAGRLHPPARVFTSYYAAGFGLAAAIWVAVALLPASFAYFLIPLAIVIDIATPLSAGERTRSFPLSPSHLGERFMLFTLIMLGEIVFSLLRAGIAHPGHEFVLAGAIVLPLLIWWLYYRNVSGSAIRGGATSFRVFLFGHLPLALGLAGIGAGLKLIWEAETAAFAEMLLAGGAAISVASLAALASATLCSLDAPRTHERKVWSRYAAAAAIVAVGVAFSVAGATSWLLPAIIGVLAVLSWYDTLFVMQREIEL